MRYAILAITLRFIATGDLFHSLEFLMRVSRRTISSFVPQVIDAIYKALQPSFLKFPGTVEKWSYIANDFDIIWDFPHILGTLDGKHIRTKAPSNSGSTFCNYKGFFSVVLFALVDAHSRFIFIDVGANGRSSDSTI